jgi:UrcA family protein
MKRIVIAALAALTAGPALAAVSVTVRTGGLDLNDARDAAVMLRRLDIAAAEACGADRGSVREVQTAIRRSACYDRALGDAVAALNAPTVKAVHDGRRTQITQR